MESNIQTIDYRDYPVLFVDDEPENLRTFELAFRRELSIVTARSASEALEVLSRERIAVVLSDHRMPETTGVELLSRARMFVPEVIRILVTAYGDAPTLARAINDGAIYRYVGKPWNIEEMRSAVRQAIERFSLELDRSRLLDQLGCIVGLAQQLAEKNDIIEVREVLERTITEDLGFDHASLALAESGGRSLRWVGDLRSCHADAGDLVELSEEQEPALFAMLRKRQVVSLKEHGYAADVGLRHFVSAIAADDVVVVPIGSRGRLVGAVLVDNRRGGKRIGKAECGLLEGVSAQAAMVLDGLGSSGGEEAAEGPRRSA